MLSELVRATRTVEVNSQRKPGHSSQRDGDKGLVTLSKEDGRGTYRIESI